MRNLVRTLALRRLSRWPHGRVTLKLAHGDTVTIGDPGAADRAEATIHDDRFFVDLLLRGEIGAGEAYVDGLWDSDDLVGLLRLLVRGRSGFGLDGLAALAARPGLFVDRVRHLLRHNSRGGSLRNVRDHYDLGNDFFGLFLDESRMYSCAIFDDADGDGADTLEAAQRRKLDAIFDRLALGPRDRLIDLGGGWGGLAVHAARTRGCTVTLVTLSAEQAAFAASRVQREGLADRVTVERRDYRDVRGRYDKLTSVEMLEAIGHEYLPAFFSACARLLAPGGAAVVQTITMSDGDYDRYRGSIDWMRASIFPGSCIPSLGAIRGALAGTGLSIESIHEIGPHYAPTLRAWRERLSARRDEARALRKDGRFLRAWELYFAFSEASFAERTLGDAQLRLARA